MSQNIRKQPPQSTQTAKQSPKPATNAAGNTAGNTAADKSAKTFTLNVGFSALMTALLVLLGSVVVAFMLGVIVGRGQEESIPVVGAIVPATLKENNSEKQTDGGTSHQAPYATSSKEKADGNKKIMTPEELKYAKDLKNKDPQRTLGAVEQKPADKAKDKNTDSTDKKTDGVNASQEQNAEKAKTIFDYVFQVSSLKDENSVDTLRADLEAEGMRTRMAKAGEYFIVFVHMRGTEQQAKGIRERLIELKLGNPLLKQKTAVR